jgi:hypothetical protein
VTGNVRWTVDELLEWISDAQRQICLVQPNAYNVHAVVKLAAGSRQTIPADGWLLCGVYTNVAPDGVTYSRAIRPVTRHILDTQDPYWHGAPAVTAVYNYVYDVTDQRAYYVYPPSDGTGYVAMNYYGMPPEITDPTAVLALDNIWLTPIVDYTVFRALSKDNEFAGSAQLAGLYFSAFSAAVGSRDKAEKQDSADSTFSPPGAGNYAPPSPPGAPQ